MIEFKGPKLVSVSVDVLTAPPWPGGGTLDLIPALTCDRKGNKVALVFSVKQAELMLGPMFDEHRPLAVLCIDVPRCKICTSVANATTFFMDEPPLNV